jgi:hypothetical protein
MRHASYRALLVLAWLVPAAASAQAWLPDKGVFNSTFLFNDVLNKEHWTANGDTVDVGHTRSQTYALLANYGLTDRVMLSGSLPFVNTKYWGPPSHGGLPGHDVDDGDEHGALTDLRLGVHYQLMEQPFALAPYVAYVIPVSSYYTRGHAAQGRDLEELLVGFSAGKSLDRWLPRTYAQLRYTYGFVEQVMDVAHDRDNLNVEIGTFISARWNVSLYGAWQWAHGGINPPIPPSSPYFPVHDKVLADEFFNAGVGTGFALTPQLTTFAMYMHGFEGKSGHKMNHGFTLGFSYGYRPRASAVFEKTAEEEASDAVSPADPEGFARRRTTVSLTPLPDARDRARPRPNITDT